MNVATVTITDGSRDSDNGHSFSYTTPWPKADETPEIDALVDGLIDQVKVFLGHDDFMIVVSAPFDLADAA